MRRPSHHTTLHWRRVQCWGDLGLKVIHCLRPLGNPLSTSLMHLMEFANSIIVLYHSASKFLFDRCWNATRWNHTSKYTAWATIQDQCLWHLMSCQTPGQRNHSVACLVTNIFLRLATLGLEYFLGISLWGTHSKKDWLFKATNP